jgi:hypothetical protein
VREVGSDRIGESDADQERADGQGEWRQLRHPLLSGLRSPALTHVYCCFRSQRRECQYLREH